MRSQAAGADARYASASPLLNLQSALGYSASPTPSMMSSATSSSFGVKRRWDDDVIFKNQARGTSETPKKEFVNDLLRTEFHRRFMKKFICEPRYRSRRRLGPLADPPFGSQHKRALGVEGWRRTLGLPCAMSGRCTRCSTLSASRIMAGCDPVAAWGWSVMSW